MTFTPDGTRRHHVASAAPPGGGSPFLYESGGQSGDGNGGLVYRPATVAGDTAKVVAYDLESRAVAMNVGGQTIESVYDDGGRRIARIVNSTEESFFFGRYFEVHGGQLVRHIYAGDRRIAFSPIDAPPSLTLAALADDHPAVLLARAGREAAWLNDLPPLTDSGRPVQAAGAAVLGIGLLLLAVLPAGRRRPGPFGRLRRGRVILVVVLYVTALPDWTPPAQIPEPAGVAWADCPGGPTSYPAYIVHTDHLGSTTLLTAYKLSGQTDGAVMQYLRYGPYGTPQAYALLFGTPVATDPATELTYTGQRWDAAAQLYDYGARFYDPRLARFLTTDPAREYMNPYAYVRWNPVRLVDPTGMYSENVFNLYLSVGGPAMADWYAGMSGGVAQEGVAGIGAALSAAGAGAGSSAPQVTAQIIGLIQQCVQSANTPPALNSAPDPASSEPAAGGIASGAPGEPGQHWGFGMGVIGGATAEGGLIYGVSGQGAIGGGFFVDLQDPSVELGTFQSTGGFIGGPGLGPSTPGPNDSNTVGGAFAGAGVGLFVTNAPNVQAVKGVAYTQTFNIGAGIKVSAQVVSTPSGIYLFSVTSLLPGLGLSGSAYNTTTK